MARGSESDNDDTSGWIAFGAGFLALGIWQIFASNEPEMIFFGFGAFLLGAVALTQGIRERLRRKR
jgi:hypothetical protein